MSLDFSGWMDQLAAGSPAAATTYTPGAAPAPALSASPQEETRRPVYGTFGQPIRNNSAEGSEGLGGEDQPMYQRNDPAGDAQWLVFLQSQGITPFTGSSYKGLAPGTVVGTRGDLVMGADGKLHPVTTLGEEYENQNRIIYGHGDDAVKINGIDFRRLGVDPTAGGMPIFEGLQGNYSGRAREATDRMIDSGWVMYDPKWGWIVPNAVYNAIAGDPKYHHTSGLDYMPQFLSAIFTGYALGGAGAAGSTAEGAGTAALSASDVAALTQMGVDAGLTGAELNAFVASGGTLGSAAAPGMLSGLLPGMQRGAVQGAVSSLTSGGNPLEGALRGGFTGGVMSGADQAISAGLNAFNAPPVDTIGLESLGPLASPEAIDEFLSKVPAAVPGMELPIGRQLLDITAPGAVEAAIAAGNLAGPGNALVSEPEGSTPAAPEGPTDLVSEPTAEVTRYEGYAKKVYNAYKALSGAEGDVAPFELPTREEGQSDEDYAEEVGNYAVEYLSLDPNAMREAGLVPGTQEYLDYILEQADAIIAGVFGENSADVIEGASVEDLQAAMRDLAEKEAQQLARALYTRGALGQLTFSGTVTDPFTGISEETGMLPGDKTGGAKAGQQRGYARSLENLLGMPSGEAAESLRGLLGRDIDLFGLQGSADARALAAQLAELEEDEDGKRKRRGGMVGGDAGFWNDILSKMDPRQLEALMAQFGGRSRQGAAIEQLMGRKR